MLDHIQQILTLWSMGRALHKPPLVLEGICMLR